MRIAKTKQTRKRLARRTKTSLAINRKARRSTPPFSPLLGMLGGVGEDKKESEVPAAVEGAVEEAEEEAVEEAVEEAEEVPAKSETPTAEEATAESEIPTEVPAETANANAELSKLDSKYALELSKLINDAKIPTTLKLLKSVIYGINEKPFSKDIKEYESVLNHDTIQKGTLNLEEAQQAIAAALWKKLVLTLAE
jgi:cell division septation protein DedD